MAAPFSGWTSIELGRRDYFICQALLVVAVFFVPYLMKSMAPLISMWLFFFRARSAGRRAWGTLGLVIVAVEMFGGEILRWALAHFRRDAVGYAVLGWIMLHVIFAAALGVLKPKAATDQGLGSHREHSRP